MRGQWHEPCRASLEIIRKLLDAHRILGLAADSVGVNRRRVRTALQHHDLVSGLAGWVATPHLPNLLRPQMSCLSALLCV